MTLEQDDDKRAIDEAAQIFEEDRQITVEIPLHVAYWVGTILVTAYPKDGDTERQQLISGIVSRLEQVVPQELVEQGSEDYSGDLSRIVVVPFSSSDVDFIGQTAKSIPTGRQIIGALPIDPKDRAELDGYRNKLLRSFLSLSDAFARVGGITNPTTRKVIEDQLS